MKFTIIENNVKGFKLDFKNDITHHNISKPNLNPYELERYIDEEIDGFYDLADGDAKLCSNENDELYAVDFDWETKEPRIWQKVIKA